MRKMTSIMLLKAIPGKCHMEAAVGDVYDRDSNTMRGRNFLLPNYLGFLRPSRVGEQ
jgi:hypothetical protein